MSPLARCIGFFLENRLVAFLLAALLAVWGLLVAPFAWDLPGLPRDPVPVDAIPDTGDNQQIVFTGWPGRSPQDVEDQITYPLTVALLGVPGVKSIRSSSMFGFSSIFVVFEDDVEFYWSRSRLLEKLSSLPSDTLPGGVQPTLGPDATALGQVFWYTLEGRDEDGAAAGGWGLEELRSIQDWRVRYALSSVPGVAEVASVGGFVKEYQIDVDPAAMRAHGVTLQDVFRAIADSNVDVGARTIEVNRTENVVRGIGLLEGLEDIEATVVAVNENVPITVRQIATVALGPALRRGALDKGGAEAVGGVVVARFGANPLEVIEGVRAKLAQIAPSLPSKELSDGRLSRVTVVPFYDRSELIQETLGTLESALEHEILVTVIVVLVMLGHLKSALLVSSLLPLAVLACFIAMKHGGVDANVVALSGIAIAIGTIVDVGIVLTESILARSAGATSAHERLEAVRAGATEVGGAVLTAVLTTVVSFLPVFTMQGAEGKLFEPLAFTKTFVLLASIVVALLIVPAAAYLAFGAPPAGRRSRAALVRAALWVVVGAAATAWVHRLVGVPLVVVGLWKLLEPRLSPSLRSAIPRAATYVAALALAVLLSSVWEPLGVGNDVRNALFTVLLIAAALFTLGLVVRFYERLLGWCLAHKAFFLALPATLVVLGALAWRGFDGLVGPLLGDAKLEGLRDTSLGRSAASVFPGLGHEFMPALDEGSFLLMPITMAHASIGEALELLQAQDRAIAAIPEVEDVVGKLGRVESALDPAPVSMFETLITYVPEYRIDGSGRRLRFRYDGDRESFVRDAQGELVPDEDGRPYRNWREHIRSPDDIWDAIDRAARMPGLTTASQLQPIETRRIMLQTGMRAAMGVKVFGPDLETIERVALDFEKHLADVPSLRPETVLADRVIGKPYLEIDIDRNAIARHGLSVRAVQDVIEVAIGGRPLTTAVEGRERYPVRVRYQRELRDRVEDLGNILVPVRGDLQVPLGQLAEVRHTRGPQNIKSEDTFLVAYVLFDKQPGIAEVEAVEDARAHLAELISSGAYVLPEGVSYRFAGSYENQVRAEKRLRVVLPLALFVIFLILYLQFRSVTATAIVFSSVFVAWSGGFLLLWLYGTDGFLDFELFGANVRELFQVGPVNLSVAVWVGFLALFGIATDDGVLLATYIRQQVQEDRPRSVADVRRAVIAGGKRRIRPCMMTTATTVLALAPVVTSTGRGADVMVPMALPSVGGMAVALVTVFVVPTLYCLWEERKLKLRASR